MEETAKAWRVSREAQDDWALKSHQRAVAGWERGFFDDLVISLPELARDANPRADTSPERLAALKPAFDRDSGRGTLTAGNSSPITDGAAGCWVATEAGVARLPAGTPYARLVDRRQQMTPLQLGSSTRKSVGIEPDPAPQISAITGPNEPNTSRKAGRIASLRMLLAE